MMLHVNDGDQQNTYLGHQTQMCFSSCLPLWAALLDEVIMVGSLILTRFEQTSGMMFPNQA